MAATVVTVDRNLKAGVLPILRGHWVTLTAFFKSLFLGRPRPSSTRSRSAPSPTATAASTSSPSARTAPPSAWPATCAPPCARPSASTSRPASGPEKTIEKYPTRFEIDLLRCVYCGFCVDACPEEAIIMSRENDLVGTSASRADHRPRPARWPATSSWSTAGATGPVDHDVRRPVRIAALERLEKEHGIVPGHARGSRKTPAPESTARRAGTPHRPSLLTAQTERVTLAHS